MGGIEIKQRIISGGGGGILLLVTILVCADPSTSAVRTVSHLLTISTISVQQPKGHSSGR